MSQVNAKDPAGADRQRGESAPGDQTVRSVTRALDIMALFTDGANQSRGIGEIVEETGLAKTTVIRLLSTLESYGLLAATARGYVPGPGLWRWGFTIHQAWELPEAARGVMRELVEEHQETVNLYIRRGHMRICVAQEESPLPLRHVVRLGDQLPLSQGASSKALLSATDDGLIRELFVGEDVDDSAREEFIAEVRRCAADGYAQSHGERETGLSAVAVPVAPTPGTVTAALSFSGPTARFPQERVAPLVTRLTEAATVFATLGFDHPLRSA